MNSTNVFITTINISGLKKVQKYPKKCEHGRRRNYCKQCGGSSICEHGKQCNKCKQCGGSSICEHGKIRSTCIMCSKCPLLECTFSLCNFKTKVKHNYNNHVKIHSDE